MTKHRAPEHPLKRFLFLAYYFPPVFSSGVYRSLKFVKYLPQFGWQPYVISTTEATDIRMFDPSLLAEVPAETPIWRLPTPEPRPYSRLAAWIRGQKSMPEGTNGETITSPAATQSAAAPPWLKKLLKAACWPLTLIENPPVDKQLYWSLRAIPLAQRLVRQHDLQVIYTSAAPWSVLLVGLLLKRRTGRPWVLDMRDPWTSHEYLYHHYGFRRRIDILLERAALRAADRVLITSPAYADELEQVAAAPMDDKTALITNGFDEEDFTDPPTRPATGARRTLAYAGALILDRLDPLGNALCRLLTSPEVLGQLRFVFYGWQEPRIDARIRELGIADYMLLLPAVEHRQAVALMQQSDALLLLLGTQPHWRRFYTGKIFEYLRAGKPVLGIGPRGVAAELIERAGVGCFVEGDDTPRLATVLRQIAMDYPGFLSQYYHPKQEVIAQYERRVLTSRLAEILDTVSSK